MVELVCLVGLFGLLIGSFLNVVIHRVPRGESLVRPPSRCPACGRDIRARHNIPVVGWLALRGRCADCGEPISVRYPLVELGTGLVFAALALQLGLDHELGTLPALLYFAAIGIALALIDVDVRRLPNAIVLPSYPVLAVLLALAAFLAHDWWAFGRAVIGAAALFAFYFVLAMAYPAGMGFGDVRLAGLIGGVLAFQSWSALVIGAFGGFVLGAVVGVAVIAGHKGDRKTALPFGPFMIAAALAAIFVATPIADAYRSLLGV
ncbi:MAG TPA: prepilin peptidase [Pseudonocardiaceae bacterium]|nr:prepilin peptidase [Pseudonocardiaceae bacterium]